MEISCNYIGYVYEDSQAFKITFILCAILNLLLSIPTSLFNLSIFIVTLRCKKLPDVTQVFFASLSLADLFTGCFSQFTSFIKFTALSLGKSPCFISELAAPVSFLVVSVSFFTSVCLAIERYISVMHPFVYNDVATQRKAIGISALVWLICTVGVAISFIKRNLTPIDIFTTYGFLCFELICLVCYSRVYLEARRIRKQIRTEQKRLDTQSTRKTKSNLMFTTCLIILSFFCCHAPFQLVCLFKLHNVNVLPGYSVYWGWTIAHLNAFINPLITCCQLSVIRNDVLSLWKRSKNHNITTVIVKNVQTNGFFSEQTQ